MLSKDQYSVLGFLYDQKEVCIFNNDDKQISLLIDLSESLIKDELISGKSTTPAIIHDTFTITEKGKYEWELHLADEQSKQIKIETVNIAKQANILSEESNQIARSSKKLSFAAIIVSCIAILVSIAGIIVSAIF